MKPRGWKQGDPISASRLNGTNAEAGRPRRQSSTGTGSSMVNETMGNQSHAAYEAGTRLVIAKEDFGPLDISTDIYGVNDPQYSGKCMMMRLVSDGDQPTRQGLYEEEVLSQEFRVWDPIALLSSTASKSEGDIFYTVYNKDSKRWEVLTAAKGVVTEVRFQIVSSDPTTFTGLAEVLAWDYGFTLTQVPALIRGLEPQVGSVIEICDPRACFLNEPNVDLTGRQGTAVYRQGVGSDDICRTGYEPFPGVWEVDGLCCRLLSCDVVI